MHQNIVTITGNTQLCESMFQIDFSTDTSVFAAKPGQFLTARVSSSITPLLRRPFAFSDCDEKNHTGSFIYQVRGTGTSILSEFRTGVNMDVIAPLGNTFPLPEPAGQALLIAGGIGLGPMLFLARYLQLQNIPFAFIFGCRTKTLWPEGAFDGLPVTVCTDDGSCGFQGSVIDYLQSITIFGTPVLYACGPHPMLHACHSFAHDRNLRCVVSVEQIMACGVGACMGCAVKINGPQPYARACKEGPIFESEVIRWE